MALSSQPRAGQLMESNPEFAQLLNNPQVLQESLQMAANPVRKTGKVALAHMWPCPGPALQAIPVVACRRC